MPRRKKSDSTNSVSAPSAPADEPIDDQPIQGRVFKRPDGYYWDAKGRDARGPFATRAEAEADLLAGGTAPLDFEPGTDCRERNPSSAFPSGSIRTPAGRRRTASPVSRTTRETATGRSGERRFHPSL
jgi:hypothetical protein